MNDKQIARNAQAVQNLQIKLVLGMIAGFVVGVLVGAYLVIPAMPGAGGLLLGVACPIIGIFVGQRAVLSYLSR